MMPNLPLALLLASICLVSACGGDDDPIDLNQNQHDQNQHDQNQHDQNQSETTDRDHPSRVYEDHEDTVLCLVPRGDLSKVVADEVALEAEEELSLAVSIFLLSWMGSGSVVEEYCTVDFEDDQTLRVHTYVAYGQSSSSSGGDSSVPDRRFFACDAPPLEAGHYTVIHGAQTYQLEVPAQSNLDCDDSEFNQMAGFFDD